jgi:hypothetical protein
MLAFESCPARPQTVDLISFFHVDIPMDV